MMLKPLIAMTLTMGELLCPFRLLVCLLNGVFSGFVPNSTALIASQVPKNQSGYALGTLSDRNRRRYQMGPLLGGLVPRAIWYACLSPHWFSSFSSALLNSVGH